MDKMLKLFLSASSCAPPMRLSAGTYRSLDGRGMVVNVDPGMSTG